MQAVFYRDRGGEEPVASFLDQLPLRQQVVLDNQIDRLSVLYRRSDRFFDRHASLVALP